MIRYRDVIDSGHMNGKQANDWNDWSQGVNLRAKDGRIAVAKCLYDAKVASITKGVSRQDFANEMKTYLCNKTEVFNSTVQLQSCPNDTSSFNSIDCSFMDSTNWMSCEDGDIVTTDPAQRFVF